MTEYPSEQFFRAVKNHQNNGNQRRSVKLIISELYIVHHLWSSNWLTVIFDMHTACLPSSHSPLISLSSHHTLPLSHPPLISISPHLTLFSYRIRTTGKFRIPFLRGVPGPSVEHFRCIERAMADNLDNWLCNVYLEVRQSWKTSGVESRAE